jgi:multidrug efflux pump
MTLADLSVRRPVFATVLCLALVLVGVATLLELPVREFPRAPAPVVSVNTSYPGAAADAVESQVTRRLEDQLAGLEGVSRITSFSSNGSSQITIEFAIGRDLDQAANDVRNRVSRAVGLLPTAAARPRVVKAGSGIPPALWISVRSDRHSILDLTDITERQLVDRLASVDGVAGVRVAGAQGPGLRIWLDANAMAARGITADDVASRISEESAELPAGRIVSRQREFALRTSAGLETPVDFETLIVRQDENGRQVRLRDIADVRVAATGLRWSARANGQPTLSLGIEPTADANPIEIADAVRARLAAIIPSLPDGVTVAIDFEQAGFAREAIRQVVVALGWALLLVVGVIFLFLGDLRATLVPALTIPICLVASFAAVAAFGYTVNILILLGLVLAIGLVVDDAIVVLENIYRHVEAGRPPLLAATDGAREITFAVIATTVVLVAVFLPLSFMGGRLGRLFSEFGVVLSAAVAISSLVALTLVPMLCSKLYAGRDAAGARLGRRGDAAFGRFADAYRRILRPVVARPWWMLLLVAAVAAAAVQLFRVLPAEHTPRVDRNVIRVMLHAPPGSSFEYTERHGREMETVLLDEARKGEITQILVRVPAWGAGGTVNSGRAVVRLVPRNERSRSAADIAADIDARLEEIPGASFWTVLPRGLGIGEDTRPVRLVLGGNDYGEVADWADRVVDAAQDHPALASPRSGFESRQPRLKVDIDRERAADLGVSLDAIGRTLETMLGSRQVATYTVRDRDYPVVLQGRAGDRSSTADLAHLHVRSEDGESLVPLSQLVSLRETTGPATYVRINRLRTVTVSAGVGDGYTLGEALDALEGLAGELLPEEARLDYAGESRRFREAGGSLETLFVLALLAVFLVLAAQFESFVNPLIIMAAVPLAVTGALLGLVLTDNSLNVYSRLGIVILVGLAAKNGVLIVEFANQLRDRGLAFREAVVEAAAIRLRPVLMTSFCTAAGALPLLIAGGADAESRRPLGAVILSGVLVSALLTLFVVPGLYALMARNTRSPGHIGGLIRKLRKTADTPLQQDLQTDR